MKIIIDAMGGDHAPEEIVKGAVLSRKEFGVEITLVGRKDEIVRCLEQEGVSAPYTGYQIVHTEEVITMEDEPSTAIRRKRDSSMAVALTMLKHGEGDAVISAGSTGALLTGATLLVRRIRGIQRAAMAPVLPSANGGVLLIDCGANVECTPEYLLQFAYMGSFYAKNIMGRTAPRVGLLNIGTEDTKGGELQKKTFELLRNADSNGRIHFIGNVEAKGIFSGDVDVLVTDGFSGNILLKAVEGTAGYAMGCLKRVFLKNLKTKLAAVMIKSGLREIKHSMDPNEVGGTAMLGISAPVFKAHGSSDARAICNAVRQAITFVDTGVIGEIQNNIEYMRLHDDTAAE